MSFPYTSLKLSQLLFLIGLLLATLNVFLYSLSIAVEITTLLQFIGLFLTGWALLSFAVTKQLLKNQKLVAIFFALVILTGVFGLKILFKFDIAPYNTLTW